MRRSRRNREEIGKRAVNSRLASLSHPKLTGSDQSNSIADISCKSEQLNPLSQPCHNSRVSPIAWPTSDRPASSLQAGIDSSKNGALKSHASTSDTSYKPHVTPNSWRISRYLTDDQRHDIVCRIVQGEKQSVLAKEYAVSRAAICNLYKRFRDKDKVNDTRLMKLPGKASFDKSDKSSNLPIVPQLHQIASHSLPIQKLLQCLHQSELDALKFRHAIDRLVNLALEEAIASVSYTQSQFATSVESLYWEDRCICGIVIDGKPGGAIMLQAFSTLYPWSQTAAITLRNMTDMNGLVTQWEFHCSVRKREGLRYFLLMIEFFTSTEITAAIYHLAKNINILESDIYVIALFTSITGAQQLLQQFPGVTVFCARHYNDLQIPHLSSRILSKIQTNYWTAVHGKVPNQNCFVPVQV